MVFANPVPTRSLVLFQGLPEAITMPLSTCSHLVTISQKPDTKSHNSRFLRAVGVGRVLESAIADYRKPLLAS